MRDDFPLTANRGNLKRRSSLGMTAGAAAALGALAGCGDDGGGGGGAAAPADNSTFTGGSGGDTHDLVTRGAALMTVDAGTGDDTVRTGAGAQSITGGLGNDTINGGAGEDVAVYAGDRDGFAVTATLATTAGASPVVTVTDAATTGAGEVDEGTDTLTSIEQLRFNSGGMTAEQVNVGLVFGDNTANGTLTGAANHDIIFGFAGNDTITGMGGDDTIHGGAGNDTVDGGAGMDTAVFSGARTDYRIWMEAASGDNPARFHVLHEESDADMSNGRDTLTNVEMIRFGTEDAVELNAALAMDNAAVAVAGTARTDDVPAGTMVMINVSGWFTSADDARVTYTASVPTGMGTATVEGNMVTFTAPATTGMVTLTVTASDVANETYDNISLEHVITVVAASDSNTPTAGRDTLTAAATGGNLAGLAGNDTFIGGAGNDYFFGNTNGLLQAATGTDDTDEVVFAGELGDYTISAELFTFGMGVTGATVVMNTPRITVTDNNATEPAAPAIPNEGMDTLVGIESVKFLNGTDVDTDDATLMIVETGTDAAEILLGDETENADLNGMDGADYIFGFAMNDTIMGGGGNDTIHGGAGNDTIDGGAGMDTAVYSGARTAYRIWMEAASGDNPARFHVLHEESDADMSDGRDTLTNVEMIQFGDAAAVALDADLATDNPAVAVAGMAPTTRTEGDVPAGTEVMINVSGWFTSADGARVTYTASVPTGMGTATVEGNMVTFTAPATTGMVTLTVTASDVANETYDDISHEHVITVGAASDSNMPTAGRDTLTAAAAGGILAGLAGNDTFISGSGNDYFFGNTNGVLQAATGTEDTDQVVFAGELDDYTITAALHTFGMGVTGVTEVENTPRITVTDNNATEPAAPAVPNEGMDTLVGIESVKFLNGTDVETDDVTLMIVGTGTDAAEILLGDESANAMLDGMNGADFIFGFAMNDTIMGGGGNDTIDGGAGGDTITGGAGGDTIMGGDDNDTITGGAGDDTIDGGAGMDTAVFAGAVGDHRVSATLSGMDVTFTVTDTDATIPASPMVPDEGMDTLTNIEMLQFGSETLGMVTAGTAMAEIVTGTATGNGTDAGSGLMGLAGDDLIFGFDGDDFISGGEGDDVIDGGAGDDTAVFVGGLDGYTVSAALSGTTVELTVVDTNTEDDMEPTTVDNEGTDTLINVETVLFGMTEMSVVTDPDATGRMEGDAEIIVGSATADGMAAADMRLEGDAGNDMIFGLDGDDHLEGGAGDDKIFGGDGMDTAYYEGARADYLIWRTGTGADLVTHVVDKNSMANGDLGRDELTGVEMIGFGTAAATEISGLSFDTAPIPTTLATGADEPPNFLLFTANDTTQNASNWFVNATTPARTFTYSLNAAATTAGFSINAMGVITQPATLTATTSVTITASVDATGDYDDFPHTVMFTVPSAGNDLLAPTSATGGDVGGQAGNDTFFSGPGNDDFFGNTDMLLQAASGTDDTDKVVFAGVVGDYFISAELHTFGMGVSGATEVQNAPRITVIDNNATAPASPAAPDEGTDTLVGIESIEFRGGSGALELMIVETGTDSAEILLGDETANSALNGMNGADFIFGFAMNDTITGGAGDDIIDGGSGEDTAVFLGELENFHVTAALSGNDVTFTVVDLLATGAGGDEGTDILKSIERLMFGSATFIRTEHDASDVAHDDGDLILGDDSMQGASIQYRLEAGGGDDVIFGFGGGDFIGGDAGDDVISGGAGDDNIDGGQDMDTAVYSGAWGTGDGYDFFWDYVLQRLIVLDTDTGTIDEGEDALLNIETIRFGDRDFTVIHNPSASYTGGATHDVILGDDTSGGTRSGGDGDDFLFGGDEGDTLSGGEGNDTLYGENHEDTLNGGAGDDRLFGGSSDDTIDGGGDNDTLEGGGGSDMLIGGSGSDKIYGNTRDAAGPSGDNMDIVDFMRNREAADVITTERVMLGGTPVTKVTVTSGTEVDELWDVDFLKFGTENIDVENLPVWSGAATEQTFTGPMAITQIDISTLFSDGDDSALSFTVNGSTSDGAIGSTGLTRAGNMITGTPTAIGATPLTITATDPSLMMGAFAGVSADLTYTITRMPRIPETRTLTVDSSSILGMVTNVSIGTARKNIIIDEGITSDTAINFDLSNWFTDPADGNLTYEATGFNFGGVTISQGGVIGGVPSASSVSATDFTLNVTNAEGGEISHAANFRSVTFGTTVNGTEDDDLLILGTKDPGIIDGKGGNDTVSYGADLVEFVITRSNIGITIQDIDGRDHFGNHSLQNIELAVFGDGTELVTRQTSDFLFNMERVGGGIIIGDEDNSSAETLHSGYDGTGFTNYFNGRGGIDNINLNQNSTNVIQFTAASDSTDSAKTTITGFGADDRIHLLDIADLKSLTVTSGAMGDAAVDIESSASSFKFTVNWDNDIDNILSRIFYSEGGASAQSGPPRQPVPPLNPVPAPQSSNGMIDFSTDDGDYPDDPGPADDRNLDGDGGFADSAPESMPEMFHAADDYFSSAY